MVFVDYCGKMVALCYLQPHLSLIPTRSSYSSSSSSSSSSNKSFFTRRKSILLASTFVVSFLHLYPNSTPSFQFARAEDDEFQQEEEEERVVHLFQCIWLTRHEPMAHSVDMNIEQPELPEEHVASATTIPNNVAGPSGKSKQVSVKGKNAVTRDMVNAVHVVAASISEVARKQVTPRPNMSTCIAAVEELNLDPLTECRVLAHLEQDMKSHTFMALKPEKRLFWLHVELDI